ncbi:MAG TPA: hypothetical protein VG146_18230, partial [Verrucomicrobiae bacterium]|nr:hypothetical protein [Verrucomicrobiae bacterium]
ALVATPASAATSQLSANTACPSSNTSASLLMAALSCLKAQNRPEQLRKLIAAVNGGGIYTWQSTPTPVLNIKPSGANLLLSWTVPSMNFVLQESPDLTTGIWSNVTAIRTLSYSNLQYQVSLPAPEGGWFFRLISP